MRSLALAALSVILSFMSLSAAVRTYSPSDTSAIRIVGRTEKLPDGALRFDWSGIYAETLLDGRALSLRLGDTRKSQFDIFVDGRHTAKVKIQSPDTTIVIAENLPRGQHSIAIRKATEGEVGATTFYSFILPKGGTLKAAQPRKRHIEIIGNSLSAGYGTEGKHAREPYSTETVNCNLAYSTIVPRYFDADYTILAHSGRGMVRNYGDSVRASAVTMRDKFLQVLDMDTLSRWNFEGSYRPDLVIINLGSNDFSTEPNPYRSEFVSAYVDFIRTIRQKYGEGIHILCFIPYSMDTPSDQYVREAVEAVNLPTVKYLRMPVNALNETTDRGSNWHPNYQGQRKMAMYLIPFISTMMDWPLTIKAVE